uniref:Uncharacterized protein n=1 Tax=viral metagenome TaxID=1070528 RepID=A0A6C0KE38_9ZZZZ
MACHATFAAEVVSAARGLSQQLDSRPEIPDYECDADMDVPAAVVGFVAMGVSSDVPLPANVVNVRNPEYDTRVTEEAEKLLNYAIYASRGSRALKRPSGDSWTMPVAQTSAVDEEDDGQCDNLERQRFQEYRKLMNASSV